MTPDNLDKRFTLSHANDGYSMMTGVEVMKDLINRNPDVLPNHKIQLVHIDGQCIKKSAVDAINDVTLFGNYKSMVPEKALTLDYMKNNMKNFNKTCADVSDGYCHFGRDAGFKVQDFQRS